MKKNRIAEAKDVSLYKKMLNILGNYIDRFPATGCEKLFQVAVEQGVKIIPKDRAALNVLDHIFDECAPTAIQKLLNIRFSDLPVCVKPLYKNGRKHLVAFWNRDNVAYDRVKELIDFAGTGKAGSWSNLDGDKVTLIDMSKEEE